MSDLTRFNVISSRIRLARNVKGIAFPLNPRGKDSQKRSMLPPAVDEILHGSFDYTVFKVSQLGDTPIKSLVERHLISPALVRNRNEGAAIVEKSEGLSVMINEEDHIREQCVESGFALEKAYERIDRIDDLLISRLPIAFDEKLGFLTACPTNLGTGMRASTMLFLPALRLADAIEDAVKAFTDCGLTIRGVYGEGSTAAGDTYQLSNTRSLGLTELEIIELISRATVTMCTAEAAARDKLMRERGSEIKDRIFRSFGTMNSAYSLSSDELTRLISDVKLGVILDILPLKHTAILDVISYTLSAASLTMKMGEPSPAERDIARAKLLRKILSEAEK